MAGDPVTTLFVWNKKRTKAAMCLAQGMSINEAAREANCGEKSIDRWLRVNEFSQEVDHLSLMIGLAGRAARVRMAKQVVRQRIFKDKQGGQILITRADLLDWLKFIQSETDGVKLGLFDELEAFLKSAAQPVAGSGSPGPDAGPDGPHDPAG